MIAKISDKWGWLKKKANIINIGKRPEIRDSY